jgi:Mce-associated membrane protein
MATATTTDTAIEVTPDGRPPEDSATGGPTGAPPATRFRAVLLGLLAVAVVVSGATAFHLGSSRHVWPFAGGTADRTQADREAVMGQTQQFVLRLNSYGPVLLDSQGRMPDYRRRVKEVITPKFAVSFDQSVAVAEQSVKNYGLHRTCAVFATGVELLDSDSAQVLVAGSFSQTARDRKGKEVPTGEPAPFRLRVSLDKIDGRWLVDDYQPVTTS